MYINKIYARIFLVYGRYISDPVEFVELLIINLGKISEIS